VKKGKIMAKNIDVIESRKVEDYGITPCDVIFNHVDKPQDYLYCRSINLYDDRWRVNVYSKRYVDEIEGKFISSSYFIQFNKGTGGVTFVSSKI
jgi:hypothetical protein